MACPEEYTQELVKRPVGRPSEYTSEIAQAICAELAAGHSLNTVCRQEHMPSAGVVYGWLSRHPEFAEMYARAKDDCCYAMAEAVMDIADDGSNDWMAIHDPDNPGYRFNGEHVQRSRLRVEARKWFLSKLQPKKYGDRLETTVHAEIEVRDRRREMDALIEVLQRQPSALIEQELTRMALPSPEATDARANRPGELRQKESDSADSSS